MGGFGTVWMAEQQEPIRRRVALKIIKLGMDTREVIARFEAERQALALMEHPNIARVFDAGTTDSGRPYFVMELVRGVPITRYCDENRVPAVERLRLFLAVCQAVQEKTGRTPEMSTTGGTSDGRFIAPTGAQVVELGVINATIHKVNENVKVADVDTLTATYERVMELLLAAGK